MLPPMTGGSHLSDAYALTPLAGTRSDPLSRTWLPEGTAQRVRCQLDAPFGCDGEPAGIGAAPKPPTASFGCDSLPVDLAEHSPFVRYFLERSLRRWLMRYLTSELSGRAMPLIRAAENGCEPVAGSHVWHFINHGSPQWQLDNARTTARL